MEILSRDVSEAILRRNDVGRLGCFSPGADESYVVPISYRYRDGCVYFACLPGQKLRYLKEHPTGVCLEVEEVDNADQWSTVVVTGTVGEPSGWEHVQEDFPTMRRVTRGPLRSHFSAYTSPGSMDDLVLCVLRPTKVAGRKDRWIPIAAPAPLRLFDAHHLSPEDRRQSLRLQGVGSNSAKGEGTTDV